MLDGLVVEVTQLSMNPALLLLRHLATLEGNKLYVWCWGPTNIELWQRASEPATCLQCWVLGPRRGWSLNRLFERNERYEMVEGRRWLVLDMEITR